MFRGLTSLPDLVVNGVVCSLILLLVTVDLAVGGVELVGDDSSVTGSISTTESLGASSWSLLSVTA